jgi:hypothetical protein
MAQQFFVENRTGFGSNLAIETVAKSQPDGYTLALIGSPNAVNDPIDGAGLRSQGAFVGLRDIGFDPAVRVSQLCQFFPLSLLELLALASCKRPLLHLTGFDFAQSRDLLNNS